VARPWVVGRQYIGSLVSAMKMPFLSRTGFDGGHQVWKDYSTWLHRGSIPRSCESVRSGWRWTHRLQREGLPGRSRLRVLAFTIGMTFQVSDTDLTSNRFARKRYVTHCCPTSSVRSSSPQRSTSSRASASSDRQERGPKASGRVPGVTRVAIRSKRQSRLSPPKAAATR